MIPPTKEPLLCFDAGSRRVALEFNSILLNSSVMFLLVSHEANTWAHPSYLVIRVGLIDYSKNGIRKQLVALSDLEGHDSRRESIDRNLTRSPCPTTDRLGFDWLLPNYLCGHT